MALQMKLEHPSGLIVENAYWKIASVNGGKEGLAVRVECYLNQESAKDIYEETGGKTVLISRKKEPLYVYYQRFTPSVDEGSENFIRQAYLYLKTLPEFAEAVDC